MTTIRKTLSALCLWALGALSLHAGGILTNTNNSIRFNRMFAREGAIAIDGVYSNPAGVAYLSEGFHLSINNQSAFQTRTIWSGMQVRGLEGTPFFTPFSMNGGNELGIKKYKGEATAPILPSIQAAYNKGNWSFQAGFCVNGGGGKCTFNHGLASFERTIALIPMALAQMGMPSPTPGYSVSSYLYGRQYVLGVQLGAAYKFNDHLSVYGGGRFNIVSNKYEGYIAGISANIGGVDENLHDFFGVKAGEAATAVAYFTQLAANATSEAQRQAYLEQAAVYQRTEQTLVRAQTAVADKHLDCSQSGWSITPIIGVNYRVNDKLNIGARLEITTNFNIENHTRRDDTGLFADGVNTPHDLPGLLALGAQYEVLPRLRVGVGYHYFFDKDAEMANGKQKYLSGNTQEYLAGIEYDITDKIQVSMGGQKTNYRLGDGKFLNDMSFVTSSYSLGFGVGVKVAKNVTVNAAYFWTNYKHFKKEYDETVSLLGNDIQVHNTDEFTRTNKVFGVGVDIDF